MVYPFRRDFYYLMIDSIKKTSVTFLIGTRKCGKTVCLLQLKESLDNSKFIDFKTIPNPKEQLNVFRSILDSIENNEQIVYLLDGMTYVENAESRICEIARAFTSMYNPNTKIVFTGSQSVALNTWANRAFAGNANKIIVDFLSYSEFLRYKGLTEHNKETYNQFLYEVADFHKLKSLKNYLKGCIEETVVSNTKAYNCIFDNDCFLIEDKVDLLIDICYQTMNILHNKDKKLKDKIVNRFIGGFNNIKNQDIRTLEQAFIFLKKCDLISITSIARELDSVPDAYLSIRLGMDDIDCRKDLNEKFMITINHPMIYVQMLKEILEEEMPMELSGILLDSIVEGHVRGLLPEGFKYRTTIDRSGIKEEGDIDYINFSDNMLVHFTKGVNYNKFFDLLPDYMRKVCLTRNENTIIDGIKYIDYYSYLFTLSHSRYLSNQIR